MTFPTVAATATTNGASTNPFPVNLPGSIAAGDLLIFVLATDNVPTATVPAGWTALANVSGDPLFLVCYRIADGSEGATVSVTLSSGNAAGAISYRITGYFPGQVPEASAPTTGTSISPDSGNCTPSWGAKDNLWISCYGVKGAVPPVLVSIPSGYTNQLTNTNNRVAGGNLNLNASSQDPGAFTMAGSQSWRALTIGIRGIDTINFINKPWDIPDFDTKQVMYG